MRDRLIELLQDTFNYTKGVCIDFDEAVEINADHLLENGVIVPPCKVGDKAYHLTSIDTLEELELAEIFEGEVSSISKDEKTLWIFARYDNGLNFWYAERDIGRNLFFTKEEAEKALKGGMK